MVEILVPIARKLFVGAEYVAPQLRKDIQVGVKTHADIEEMAYRLGGRERKPDSVMLWGPDGTQIIILGAGEADAAELTDLAHESLARAEDAVKKRGTTMNFDEMRERERLPRREDVDGMIREALRDRVRRHKANPISDPPRQPLPAPDIDFESALEEALSG